MGKNYLTLIITAIVVLVVLAGAYLLLSKGNTYAPTTQTEVTTIEDSQDLKDAESVLEEENFNDVDSSLNQLDSELSSF